MTMTLVLATLLALCVLVSRSDAARPRTVEQRIGWLTERVAHHKYVCRHGANGPKRFSCAALVWTRRELAEAWHERDWARPPEPYLSIARCEQRGNGPWGVTWNAYSSSYEGGYGFAHSTWRQFRYPWMPQSASTASPREQTLVAMRLHARFGWTPWPACHIRLGLNAKYPVGAVSAVA
jgi:hypothetical protein